jgi:3'-phosphoadenosine 5'-phosphosulfate sulfotransferase (PAPS reductase)/FAD synthetase
VSDPFAITPPCTISLSGGRTSAYMLRRILDAWGGVVPDRAHVLFANTGKERGETLVFLQEIEARWRVPLKWLEYVPKMGGSRVAYRKVDFATCSRKGEPFEAMMDHERYVPNGRTRICTQNLKVLVMHEYLKAHGLDVEDGDVTEVIGFRADEPKRAADARASDDNANCLLRFPLLDAGVTSADVLAWWKTQPFDLALEPYESNCDACFMKGNAIRIKILQAHPEFGAWWSEQERKRGHRFTKKGRKTYDELIEIARLTRGSPPPVPEPDDAPMPCGCHD